MALIFVGAMSLALGSTLLDPGFISIILPMWVMAVGIVFTVSVTPNGALAPFDDRAGLAVAIYFAGQSVIVAVLGTATVVIFSGNTAWPLVAFGTLLPATMLVALRIKLRSVDT